MTWPCPLWIAHRGAGKLAPENTLAAFARALELTAVAPIEAWTQADVRGKNRGAAGAAL